MSNDQTLDQTGAVAVEDDSSMEADFARFAAEKSPGGTLDGTDKGDDASADAGQTGAEDRGAKPPSEAAEAPPAKGPADKAAPGTEAPDPWANATPEQIAARDSLAKELEDARRGMNGASKRASGLQHELNALKGKAGEQPAQAKSESQDAAQDALKSKIDQLTSDYPEIGGPFGEIIASLQAEMAGLKASVVPITEASERSVVEAALGELGAKHADFMSFQLSDDFDGWAAIQGANAAKVRQDNQAFRGWLSEQPPKVVEMATSWDPREVSTAIGLFKADRAEAMAQANPALGQKTDTATDVRRQRQLEGGAHVRSRPGVAASGPPEDPDEAFAYFARKKA